MTKPRHSVSNKALLCYFEHVEGFDVDAIRKAIGKRVDRIAVDGASAAIMDGCRFAIGKGNTITHVEPQHAVARSARRVRFRFQTEDGHEPE